MLYSFKELKTSSAWFVAWLVGGVLIYVFYGYKQKRLEEKRKNFYKNIDK